MVLFKTKLKNPIQRWMLFLMLSCGLLSVLGSCSKSDDDHGVNVADAKITPTADSNKYFGEGMNFTSDGGEVIIGFATNTDWKMEVSQSGGAGWCTISLAKGNAGDNSVKVITTANTTYDERNATLTLTAGTAMKKIIVTQELKSEFVISSKNFLLYENAGSFEVEVTSNIDYEVRTDASWIIEQPSSRGLQKNKHTFSVAALENGEGSRSGNVELFNSKLGLSEKISVSQVKYMQMEQSSVTSLFEGKEMKFSCLFHSSVTEKGLVWSSSDVKIATVNQDGMVTAIKKGSATITATSVDGVHSVSCNLTVKTITDYISFTINSSGISSSGYTDWNVYSTIKNGSDYTIKLVALTIKHPDTKAVIYSTTDSSLLGDLAAGASHSMGVKNLREVITPIFIWEYIFENARYANNEKISGSGTDNPGGTVEDMPWN